MKKKIMKLVLSLSLLSVAFLDIQTPINVRAEGDTTIEAGLKIDESVGELTGLFDSIGRFSKDGIAIIRKNIPTSYIDENGELVTGQLTKLGLINLNGQILIEPIFDSMSDYSDDYWLVLLISQSYEPVHYQLYGLVSKRTGAIVLQPKYDYIPDATNSKLIWLYFETEEYINEEIVKASHTEPKANNDGIIRDVVLPTGITLGSFDYLYASYYEKQLIMMGYGIEYDDEGQTITNKAWLVNDYGDRLVDFSASNFQSVYTMENGVIFALYQEDIDLNTGIGKEGLIKIYTVEGVLHYEIVFSHEDGYREFWLDKMTNTIAYTYFDGTNDVRLNYDLITESTIVNTDQNQSYTQVTEYDSVTFSDLTIKRTCTFDGPNNSFCSLSAFQEGSQFDLLTGHSFEHYNENPNGLVIFESWINGVYYANALAKDTEGRLNFIFENDLNEWIIPASAGLIKTYLTDYSNTMSLYSLIDGSVIPLFVKEQNMGYGSVGDLVQFGKRVVDTDGVERYISTLFDPRTSSFVLENITNLNVQYLLKDGKTTLYGQFTLEDHSTPQFFVYAQSRLILLADEVVGIVPLGKDKLKLNISTPYVCLWSDIDPLTGDPVTSERTCLYNRVGVVNSAGDILLYGVDELSYHDEDEVMIVRKSEYNPTTHQFDLIGFSYYYLNNFDSSSHQVPIIHEPFDQVTQHSDGIYLLTNFSSAPQYQYVKEGVLLSNVNDLLAQAVSVNKFDDGSMIFAISGDQGTEYYLMGINGLITPLIGVSSAVGKIVKIEDSVYYVDNDNEDMDLDPQLTSLDTVLPDLMDNELPSSQNWTYLSSALYSYRKNDGTLALIKTSLVNGVRVFELVTSGTSESLLCEIESTSQDDRFYKLIYNVNATSESCLYDNAQTDRKVGLINSSGTIIVEPNFGDINLSGNMIIARSLIPNEEYPGQSSWVSSFFDLQGRAAVTAGSLNVPTQFNYFSFVDNFVEAIKDGVSYLFVYRDETYHYIGSYRVYRVEEGYYCYYSPLSTEFFKGLLDANGNVLIDISKQSGDFKIDLVHDLIYSRKMVNTQWHDGGVYDINGQLLLSENYEVSWNYDPLSASYNTFNVDMNGFMKVIYTDPNIKFMQRYCLDPYCNDMGWAESNARFINYYNVVNKQFLNDTPIISEEKMSDGYWKINMLVKSDKTEAEISAYQSSYYLYDDGIDRYVYENKQTILKPNKETAIEAGRYDYIYWDPDNELIKVRIDMPSNQVGSIRYLYGLLKKDGTVFLEPVYSSIEYVEKYGIYVVRDDNDSYFNAGFLDSDGSPITELKYSFGQDSWTDYGWLVLSESVEIQDTEHPGSTFNAEAYALFDTKNKRIIADKLMYFDIPTLMYEGQMIIERMMEEGTQEIFIYSDEVGNEYTFTFPHVKTKFGVLAKDGSMLALPIYDAITPVLGPNGNMEMYKGIFTLERVDQVIPCTDIIYDWDKQELTTVDYNYELRLYGLLNIPDHYVIEPKFNHITIGTNGYATTGVGEFTIYPYLQRIEELDLVFETSWVGVNINKRGLLSLKEGEIIEPLYLRLQSTDPSKQGQDVPMFDGNGLIQTVQPYSEAFPDLLRYGLADKDGSILEPIYRAAYYKNGYYYMWNQDYTWSLRNAQDPTDEIHIDRIINSTGQIKSIELAGTHVIVKNVYFDGYEQFVQYGVLNKDLTVFLPFEYTSISFDGTYWYLEKYDPLTGSYPREVLDENLNVIIAATSKYDTLSEFVGGYAIGQSGTKAEPIVTLDLNFSALSMLVESQDFVLEIIDAQGQVVGDLSQEYESATLIGISDGKIKALVKKDGLFYIATLVTREVVRDTTPPIITIDPYTLLETSENIVVTAQTNEGSLNQTSFTFTENGSFTFIATDDAGNVSEVTVTITNIVKTKTVNFTVSGLGGSLNASVNSVVIVSGSKHPLGSMVTFSAAPNAGWIITQWNLNGLCLTALDKTIIVSSLSEDLSVTVEFGLLGDLNLDGATTKSDLSIFAKVMAGKIKLTGKALLVADMNQDGSVSATDLSKLSKLLTTLK